MIKTATRVIGALADQMGIDDDTITPSSTLIDDLGMDSLDRIDLVIDLEDEFGIEITDANMDRWVTVQDVITYIEGHAR